MSELQYPTEVISLPSQGKVYPESNPLSSGEIEIKYMTFQLTSLKSQE